MNATTATTNLVAKNGTVVHARHADVWDVPTCAPNMARADGRGWTEATDFLAVSADKAPVTCLDCCRKLGINAPKRLPGARKAAPALDAFEVGQTFAIDPDGGQGVIVKLAKSLVTYLPENGPVGRNGQPLTFAMNRAKARRLNP